MRAQFKKVFLLLLLAAVAGVWVLPAPWFLAPPIFWAAASGRAAASNNDKDKDDALQAFAAMEPVDTHVHAFKSDPAFTDLLARLQLHVLDICVADTQGIYN